jgi:transcriptional regulator NrdR family protein
MVQSIVKRNGNIEDFNVEKLKKSIENAAIDANYEESKIKEIVESVTNYVLESIKDLERVDSQSLEDLILNKLDQEYPLISKAWRDYNKQVKNR